MYAIIKSGGKQYRVAKDDVIDVDLLHLDQGSSVEFPVLFVNDGSNSIIGEPVLNGYAVKGEILGDAAGPKITSMKYKPRKRQHKKWGHRQHYTRVKIVDIAAGVEGQAPVIEASEKPNAVAKPKVAKTKTVSDEPKAPKKRAAKVKE